MSNFRRSNAIDSFKRNFQCYQEFRIRRTRVPKNERLRRHDAGAGATEPKYEGRPRETETSFGHCCRAPPSSFKRSATKQVGAVDNAWKQKTVIHQCDIEQIGCFPSSFLCHFFETMASKKRRIKNGQRRSFWGSNRLSVWWRLTTLQVSGLQNASIDHTRPGKSRCDYNRQQCNRVPLVLSPDPLQL